MIVGANGMQIYDVGETAWTYYDSTGKNVAKAEFGGLIDKVAYQEVNSESYPVQVFIYYEGNDARLFTANINSMKGVTVGITFSVDTTGFIT